MTFVIIDTNCFIKLRLHNIQTGWADNHRLTFRSDIVSSFVMWTGSHVWYISWNSDSFSRVGRPLRIRELTVWDGVMSEKGCLNPIPCSHYIKLGQ
jgi:hypothetical protein